MNRYIYHYCCQQQQSIGCVAYIDGIARMENRIVTHEDYKKLKKGIDADNVDKLIITSLCLIGREEEL